ncbi:putative ribonuclease H-like domain-containing protein [Tanacetum coccineum]|uniref:Ribonuclease H-like domain-containing protein n=1 Tax=Tanacetum coccineum TaxID=301880 RepID=A0ABQ5EUN2_9ASTR
MGRDRDPQVRSTLGVQRRDESSGEEHSRSVLAQSRESDRWVQLIDEDMVRQKAILDLALQFDNACTAKDDLRKAYEKCYDIPQESRALIDTFLKEGSDKDYEMNLSILNNENDQWELSLDIDDSDLRLTPVMRPSSSTRVETSHSTQNPVRIIPGPAVIEDVGEDGDFKSRSWVSVTDYVNANGGTVSGCLGDIKNFLKNGKLDQVVAIVKSCSPNVICDLTVTMKDLSGTIHHKIIGEGGYGKDITVGVALILANVSVFSPKPSMHYLKRNIVKVFRKDTILGSGSG